MNRLNKILFLAAGFRANICQSSSYSQQSLERAASLPTNDESSINHKLLRKTSQWSPIKLFLFARMILLKHWAGSSRAPKFFARKGHERNFKDNAEGSSENLCLEPLPSPLHNFIASVKCTVNEILHEKKKSSTKLIFRVSVELASTPSM